MMGNSVIDCLEAFEKEDVPAVGANCTINSEEMAGLVKEMRAATSRFIIAQANAGKPMLATDGQVAYSQGLEEYVKHVPAIAANGANFIGGCCGTNPDYIRRMAEILKA